jgi:hypothetical protein
MKAHCKANSNISQDQRFCPVVRAQDLSQERIGAELGG